MDSAIESHPLKITAIGRFKKFNKIRLHHEGTHTLVLCGIIFVLVNILCYVLFRLTIPFYAVLATTTVVYIILVNFFRCPIRFFNGDTEGLVIAPADGTIVVLEETLENEYFHDKRIMVSIFMSLLNVHANWFPVDGVIKMVKHEDGNFHKAWLPKASLENERSTVIIETPQGDNIIVRQVAGAMARRITTPTSFSPRKGNTRGRRRSRRPRTERGPSPSSTRSRPSGAWNTRRSASPASTRQGRHTTP